MTYLRNCWWDCQARSTHFISSQFIIFEYTANIPKFACIKTSFDPINKQRYPISSVSFEIKTNIEFIRKWLCNSFLINLQQENRITGLMSIIFESIKTGIMSVFEINLDNGQFVLYCDQIELAVEIINDLCAFLGVTELDSVCNFPNEISKIRSLIAKIDDFQKVKHTVSASIAEFVTQVKELAVRAEDTRMLGDMKSLKKIYNNLNANNGFILAEYTKRLENHNEMTKCINELGQLIKAFASMRGSNVT